MNDTLRQFRDFFVSLKLTVVLLALGIILIFAATLDQVNLGIWAVQEKYFRSFVVLWRVGDVPVPVFPGGYFIGGLLLINLIAAHIYRFKLTWRKAGIQLTHLGFIMLLVGELLSGLLQEDFSMRLEQDKPMNYSESQFDYELAIIDTTDPAFEDVVAIPAQILAKGEPVQHPKLPFRVIPKVYYPHSTFADRDDPEADIPPSIRNAPSPATAGIGRKVAVIPLPLTYKMNERNLPTAFVELVGAEGSLGTWLTAPHPARKPPHPPVIAPQQFEHAGRTWTIGMRPLRNYKPFTLTLLKFSHDRYPGTTIPKNFSSKIRVQTPDGRDNREVLIYMNNPLRYAGYTFFQASFEEGNDKVTILQVVRNPSWVLPYVACSLMTFGLLWQFSLHLFGFLNKRRALRPALA